MTEGTRWELALKWGVWFVVMSPVMGWLARARRPARVKERAQLLTHPPTTLILGGIATLLFGLATFASFVAVKEDERWVPALFLGFVALSATLIAEGVRVRHELDDAGIAYRGLWHRYDHIAWGEIASARWHHSMKWLALTTADGRVLPFSAMMNGLDSLAVALHERAPGLRADAATAKMLAAARAGTLPSVWM